MARLTENKKNQNTEYFREAIHENIHLMRALSKNDNRKTKTRKFYQMLIKRSDEAKKKRGSLVPLEAIR